MLISNAYMWVVHKDGAQQPFLVAMADKNPGHGKKPEQGRDFELLRDNACQASLLSVPPLLVFIF